MDFNFIEYGNNIFEKTLNYFLGFEKNIFVCKNEFEKRELNKLYFDLFDFQDNLIITFNELLEMIYNDNKIILREEKRNIALFMSLNSDIKRELNVENYYDFIDIANNFFSFEKLLIDSNIKKVKNLKKFQEKRIQHFQEIKELYREKLDEKNYTDQIFLFDLKNYTEEYLENYDKIIFINKVDFTNFDKENIRKLAKHFNIEFFIQGFNEDFDKENLKIRNINFPEKADIEIFKSNEEFLENITMLSQLGKNENIIDLKDGNGYIQIFGNSNLKRKKSFILKDSRIYNFFEILYSIYKSHDIKGTEILLNAQDLINGISCSDFRNYYEIMDENIDELYKKINYGDKYFGKNLEFLSTIINEIMKIGEIKTIEDGIDFFKGINLEFIDESDINVYSELFYSGLIELENIEDFNLFENSSQLFKNIDLSDGIFRFILKYLKLKKMDKIININSSNSIVDNSNYYQENNTKLNILNFNNNILESKTNSFFTEIQKKENSIKSDDDILLEKRYEIYQHIFNSNRCKIFYIENVNRNLESNSIIESLKMKYNISENENSVSELEYIDIANTIYSDDNLTPFIKDNQEMVKNDLDYDNKDFYISFYQFNVMQNCLYNYYLKFIQNLEKYNNEIKHRLEINVFGSFMHNIFEKVLIQNRFNIINKNFSYSIDNIQNIVNKEIRNFYLKIPKDFEIFYKELLIYQIRYNIQKLYDFLEKKLKYEKDINLYIEDSKKSKLIFKGSKNYYLNGRIDLIIETEKKVFIIDFKTGKTEEKKQLDFYENLIDTNKKVEKHFINIFDYNNSYNDKTSLDREDIINEIKKYDETQTYNRNYKKYVCMKCEYFDICKPLGIKDD